MKKTKTTEVSGISSGYLMARHLQMCDGSGDDGGDEWVGGEGGLIRNDVTMRYREKTNNRKQEKGVLIETVAMLRGWIN